MRYVIKFIPVENGTEVDLGDVGMPVDESWPAYKKRPHKLLGFRPAPGRKVAGHVVVAVAQEGKRGTKASAPRRLRAVGD